MSQLKEINGRYYQEAEVVMIATDKRSNLQLNVIHKILFSDKEGAEIPSQPFKHLYIVSNDEIKEGDWFIDLKDNTIWQNKAKENMRKSIFPECKKIISTTDSSLSQTSRAEIPQPSDSFIKKYIEEYNKSNVITKVLVEYEEYRSMLGLNIDDNTKINYSEPWYELKVDSNNCITIKKLEPELYTREEVEQYIINVYRDIYPDRHWENKAWDWIKQNL